MTFSFERGEVVTVVLEVENSNLACRPHLHAIFDFCYQITPRGIVSLGVEGAIFTLGAFHLGTSLLDRKYKLPQGRPEGGNF